MTVFPFPRKHCLVCLALVLILSFILPPDPALAEEIAIAVSAVHRKGFSAHGATKQEAMQKAIELCGDTQFCKKHVYCTKDSRNWIALALSSNGFGASNGETKSKAVNKALEVCRANSGNAQCDIVILEYR